MTGLTFGFSLLPTTDVAGSIKLVRAAEAEGLDLVGIQDHPYVAKYVDTLILSAALLTSTERIRVFPDVANLPLRPPAMLAKQAASLDLISGGRFDLAIGAGGYWEAITKMGVPRRTSREANAALEEAIAIMRAFWSPDGGKVRVAGEYYSVDGSPAGPQPAHPIEIWSGAQGPRALELTGRLTDGWAAPIPSYLPYERWAESNKLLDAAAQQAGREPRDIRRIAQLVGTITDTTGPVEDVAATKGAAPVRGTANQWATLLARLATEQPFTTFIFWPEHQNTDQVLRFARDVTPAVRSLVP